MSIVAGLVAAQQATPHACPMHEKHKAADTHRHGVDGRHDQATGVSHEASVHHFLLFRDGGRIQLEMKDAADTASRDQVRAHLEHIAAAFSDGRFDLPLLIHDRVPPGVETLQRVKAEVRYEYSPTPKGGRVDITTENRGALAAVHDFLRFQIQDHGTGDSGEVAEKR